MTKQQLIKKYEKIKADSNKLYDQAEKMKSYHIMRTILNQLELYTILLVDLNGLYEKESKPEKLNFDNHPQL